MDTRSGDVAEGWEVHEDEVLRQAQASLQPCSSLLEGGAVLDPWPWTRLGARVSSNQAYREVERIVPFTVRGCIDMRFEDMGLCLEISWRSLASEIGIWGPACAALMEAQGVQSDPGILSCSKVVIRRAQKSICC